MSLNGTHNLEQAVDRHLRQTPTGQEYDLRVVGAMREGSWVHVIVAPGKHGIRAYEFAELLAQVESRIRLEQHNNEILLVPARF